MPSETGGRPLRAVVALRDDVEYNGISLSGRADGSTSIVEGRGHITDQPPPPSHNLRSSTVARGCGHVSARQERHRRSYASRRQTKRATPVHLWCREPCRRHTDDLFTATKVLAVSLLPPVRPLTPILCSIIRRPGSRTAQDPASDRQANRADGTSNRHEYAPVAPS